MEIILLLVLLFVVAFGLLSGTFCAMLGLMGGLCLAQLTLVHCFVTMQCF